MASKSIIADLNKGDKLNGTNYDIWHRKVQYLLNEQELLDHLTTAMVPPEQGTTAQHRRDQLAYETWCKKDKSTCFTLLSCMHDDLLGEFENFPTAKSMWDNLRVKYGGTSATRLRALTLKFNQYIMDPKHSMAGHLRVMSSMIREMRAAGNDLTDEQQILAVIRSLPDPLWKDVKLVLTHNEGIKNFDDISRHLELEAERIDVNRSTALVAKAGRRKGQQKGARQGRAEKLGPKEGRITKRRKGKGGEKDKSKLKCYNCGLKGHFAQECSEPKKIREKQSM